MFGLGMQELIIVMIIVIVLFGATRLPELGKGIGQAIKNFRKGMSEPGEIDVTPNKEKAKKEEIEKKEEAEKKESE